MSSLVSIHITIYNLFKALLNSCKNVKENILVEQKILASRSISFETKNCNN